MNEKFAARATKFNDDGIPEAVYKMNSGLVKMAGDVLNCYLGVTTSRRDLTGIMMVIP